MYPRSLRCLLLAVASVCSAPTLSTTLSAQIPVFSTFGPGNSYDANNGQYVRLDTWIAAPFEFDRPFSAPLHSVSFAAAGNPPGSHLIVWLLSGAYYPNPTGSVALETWNLFSSASGIFQLASIANPILQPNTRYWLAFASIYPSGSGDTWRWFDSSLPIEGQAASFDQGENWSYFDYVHTPAFSVTVGTPVNVVPEPASMVLLATGLLGMAAVRNRRRLG